jgi:AbrB family looped-hinge helix DNA binding protein
MKLLSQISSKYKEKKYSKFWVIIPKKAIRDLGWQRGDSLGITIKDGNLIIRKEEGA